MNSITFSSSSSSSALLFSHPSRFPSSNLSSSKTLISFSSSSSSFNGIGSIRRSASNSGFRPIDSSFSGDSGFNPDPWAESGSSFCIIEGPETVQDFVQMQLQEIQDNIRSRRNKIFLLMEELCCQHHIIEMVTTQIFIQETKRHLKVRRLRVQQRIKSTEFIDENGDEDYEMPDIPSSIPFLPHMTKKTLKRLYLTSFSFISGVIVFGGLLAPTLELKLGLGGTTYEDFIRSMHLPLQLSQVDPIVASFSGGAVGVISALMLLEANNVEQQENKRCKYCHGTGYLACARCSASGVVLSIEPISVSGDSDRPLHAPTTQRCLNCSGAGKVMCPTCLCTGMVMASEHDPRIDPFDLRT